MLLPFLTASSTSTASLSKLPKRSRPLSATLQTDWHRASNLLQVLAIRHPVAAEILSKALVRQLERYVRESYNKRTA